MAKWFDPQKEDIVPRAPTIIELGSPANEDLTSLFKEIYGRVSVSTYGLLRRMALYDPPIRLSVNLRVVLSVMQTKQVASIADGLREDETKALLELEDLCLSPTLIQVAQTLLNVRERVLLIELLKDSFDRARTQRRFKLDAKPLDTD